MSYRSYIPVNILLNPLTPVGVGGPVGELVDVVGVVDSVVSIVIVVVAVIGSTVLGRVLPGNGLSPQSICSG